jgi:2-polyprenyl-3-methyl-5-hydroxy-6-metoxy-1,4-benzoquinol methylase
MDTELGKQKEGNSDFSVKKMAINALNTLPIDHFDTLVDIGSGSGTFSRLMAQQVKHTILLDAYPPQNLGPGFTCYACDLNGVWPLKQGGVSLAVALEVIEHLENPRHFFRELNRILVIDGYVFISMPHNTNFFARLLFLMKGKHRYFQDNAYPAHITPLLAVDIHRITKETGFKLLSVHYNYLDVLPGLKFNFHIRLPGFSNSVGFLLQKL